MPKIEWIRLEGGHYVSEDGRWTILKTYGTIFGNHWCLWDRHEKDYYKSDKAHEQTLKDCKGVAETILKNEELYGKKGAHNG